MKYLIFITGLFFPLLTLAALDVTFSGSDGAISANSQTITVGDGGTVDSITVDTGSFDVVLSAGASISLTNSNGNEIGSPTGNSVSKTTTCSGGSSTVTLKQETSVGGTNTVTVTPSSTSCQAPASSSSSSSSDGGGLIRAPAPTKVAEATVPAVQSALPPPSSPVLTGFREFTSNLRRGMRDNGDVKYLQELLARDLSVYPEGIVSGYFGPKTFAAVKRFQAKYNLPATGLVGPLTRAKLKEIFGSGALKDVPSPSAPTTQQEELIKVLQAQLKELQEKIKALQGQ